MTPAVAADPSTSGDVARPADPDQLTSPFWEAAAAGRLVRPVCRDCGRSFFTPAWCCPSCRSERWFYRTSSGRGQVASHTTIHRGPDATWITPYVLAVVEVEEGWRLLTRLLVAPPDPAEPGALIGAAVEAEFVPEGSFRVPPQPPGRLVPAFVPRSPAGRASGEGGALG